MVVPKPRVIITDDDDILVDFIYTPISGQVLYEKQLQFFKENDEIIPSKPEHPFKMYTSEIHEVKEPLHYYHILLCICDVSAAANGTYHLRIHHDVDKFGNKIKEREWETQPPNTSGEPSTNGGQADCDRANPDASGHAKVKPYGAGATTEGVDSSSTGNVKQSAASKPVDIKLIGSSLFTQEVKLADFYNINIIESDTMAGLNQLAGYGWPFCDDTSEAHETPIKSIIIWTTEWTDCNVRIIEGIWLTTANKTKFHGATVHLNAELNNHYTEIKMAPDEKITEIIVRHGWVIDNITIQTNKNVYGPLGGEGGDTLTTVYFPKTSYFVGLRGQMRLSREKTCLTDLQILKASLVKKDNIMF